MTTHIDYEATKKNQRAGWETGNYTRVGNTLQLMAELLVEAADVRAGQRVLDVACGQGNAAIAAALRFADATGVDYAANLLAEGRERVAVENLPVTFTEGDAEHLPFPDGSFDLALSTVGIMFAPDHQRAADEVVRVTRKGGKIALASWTPTGMVGHLFKAVAGWAPPPAGVRPGTLWGTEDHLAKVFGDRVEWVSLAKRHYVFRYHSPEHFSQWFREYYGPITKVAGTLSGPDLDRFADDLAKRRSAVQPGRRRHRCGAVGVPGGGRRPTRMSLVPAGAHIDSHTFWESARIPARMRAVSPKLCGSP